MQEQREKITQTTHHPIDRWELNYLGEECAPFREQIWMGPKEKNFSSIETLPYACCTSFSTKQCDHSTHSLPPSINYM